MLALLLFAVAPPPAPPMAWVKIIARLTTDDATAQRLAEALPEEAIPFLRRADSPSLEVDARIRLFAAAGAIRARHWGLIRAMGPGASTTSPGSGYWFNRVRFTRDGKRAVVAGGALCLYDLATGKEQRRLWEVGGARPGLDVSPDGKLVLTGHYSERKADLVELATFKGTKKLIGHEGGSEKGMIATAFSPDGKLAATAAAGGLVLIHDVATGEEKTRIVVPGGQAERLAFTREGRLLVLGTDKDAWPHALWMHDAATGKLLKTIRYPVGYAVGLAALPDGKRVLVSTTTGVILLLRLKDGKELRRFTHGGLVQAVAVSSDGLRCVTGGYHDRLVKVWDVESGRLMNTLEGHMGAILGIDFSPEGDRVLSCDAVACLRLWRVGRR